MAGFRERQQAIDRFLWVYTYFSWSLKHISYNTYFLLCIFVLFCALFNYFILYKLKNEW